MGGLCSQMTVRHTHFFQIIFEISTLQAILLTVCVGGGVRERERERARKFGFDSVLVLCFVMGYVLQFE